MTKKITKKSFSPKRSATYTQIELMKLKKDLQEMGILQEFKMTMTDDELVKNFRASDKCITCPSDCAVLCKTGCTARCTESCVTGNK